MPNESQPSAREIQRPNSREFFEAAVHSPLIPRKIFDDYSLLPAPGLPLMLGNIALWTLVTVLVYTLLQFVQGTLSLQSAGLYLFALPAVVILAVGMSLVLAWAVHGLALLSGGQGSYTRSVEIVSMLALIIPSCLVSTISPSFLIFPAVYWIYLAARGISSMYRVPFPQACSVTAASMVTLALSLWILDQAALRYRLAHPPEIDTQESPQRQPAKTQAASRTPQAMIPVESGLDLVQAPALPNQPAQQPTSAPPPSPLQLQQMQAMAAGLLNELSGLSSNPEFMRSLNSEQQFQLRRLTKMGRNLVNLYNVRSKGGTRAAALTDSEAKQMIDQLQQINRGLQSMQTSAAPSR